MGKMTIDEAIARARKESERWLNERFSTMDNLYSLDYCKKKAEEHEQLAEWLEELKSYRASVFSGNMTQTMLKEERNKAIDDFSKALLLNTVVDKSVVKRIAEQFKEGGSIGNL